MRRTSRGACDAGDRYSGPTVSSGPGGSRPTTEPPNGGRCPPAVHNARSKAGRGRLCRMLQLRGHPHKDHFARNCPRGLSAKLAALMETCQSPDDVAHEEGWNVVHQGLPPSVEEHLTSVETDHFEVCCAAAVLYGTPEEPEPGQAESA